jgi:hypothetical protein
MPLEYLGRIVATRSALHFCSEHQINPSTLLQRHRSGDWGDLSEADIKANDDAIAYGGRVFSSYSFPQGKIWIITEADRSSTCLLLPEDY